MVAARPIIVCPLLHSLSVGGHLLRLAADRDLVLRMGEAGYLRAKELFDEPRMADGYARICRELRRV